MTPQFLDFILGLLDNMQKHIEVADGHHVMEQQSQGVRITICDDNGDTLSQHCTTHFCNKIYTKGYFPILRY